MLDIAAANGAFEHEPIGRGQGSAARRYEGADLALRQDVGARLAGARSGQRGRQACRVRSCGHLARSAAACAAGGDSQCRRELSGTCSGIIEQAARARPLPPAGGCRRGGCRRGAGAGGAGGTRRGGCRRAAAVLQRDRTATTAAGSSSLERPDCGKAAAHDARPDNPYLFLKSPSVMVGANDDVVVPRGREQIDWECEFAVVVGQAGQERPGRGRGQPHLRLHHRVRRLGSRGPRRSQDGRRSRLVRAEEPRHLRAHRALHRAQGVPTRRR